MILGEDGIATAADAISDIEPKVEQWVQMVGMARNGKSNIYTQCMETLITYRMKEKKMSEFLPEATPFAAVVVLCTSPCTSGWVVGQI